MGKGLDLKKMVISEGLNSGVRDLRVVVVNLSLQTVRHYPFLSVLLIDVC